MKRIIPIIILLTGIAVAYLTSLLPWSKNIDFYAYDFLLNHTKAISGVNDIVVIGIDDKSLERFDEPLVLWHRYLAVIIDGLAESGAQATALDIIPLISLDRIAPELDRQFIQAIKKSQERGTPVYFGYFASEKGPYPHRKFIFASSGMGFLNLNPDTDGRVRKQILSLTGKSGRKVDALSSLLAKNWSLSPPAEFPREIHIDYRLTTPPAISFKDVFDWAADKNIVMLRKTFRNKIVYIGSTSFALSDIYSIPAISSTGWSRVPGVLIHSMTTSTLLSKKLFRDFPPPFILSLSLFFSVISGGLFLLLSPRKALIVIGILFIFLTAGTFQAFRLYWVMPVSSPLLALFVPGLFTGTYKYAGEYRQFRRLQRYFKSYVNDHVMQNIIDNPGLVSFEGQHLTVSVMFTDIRNFTTLSESMTPEDVVAGLNRYFAEMTGPVIQSGGYLNKYMGDGILAIFGAPQRLPEDGALAAIQCGLTMLNKVEELNNSGIFPGISEKIKIGIGIHTGEAIIGNIGCFEKMDYSAIGDTVNLASRIESATKEYSSALLISEDTYGRVKERVEARFVASARVKGRHQEVNLYEVFSMKEV